MINILDVFLVVVVIIKCYYKKLKPIIFNIVKNKFKLILSIVSLNQWTFSDNSAQHNTLLIPHMYNIMFCVFWFQTIQMAIPASFASATLTCVTVLSLWLVLSFKWQQLWYVGSWWQASVANDPKAGPTYQLLRRTRITLNRTSKFYCNYTWFV